MKPAEGTILTVSRLAAAAAVEAASAGASLESALVQAGYTVARLDTLMTHQADGDTEAYERIMLENARALKDALTAANAADR